MKVDSLKIRIVTGPESAIWKIKLVRKYELKCLRRIVEGGDSPKVLRSVWVDETPVANDRGNL